MPLTNNREADRRLITSGFAKNGETIARVTLMKEGRDGRNVHGESIPSRPVRAIRVHAGPLIRVRFNEYVMTADGKVFVYQNEDGDYFLEGKRYKKGRAIVHVSDDEMEAYLTVTPPIGGAPAAGVEDVREELAKKKVTYGVMDDAVSVAVRRAVDERMAIENVLIARGREPVNGRDGELEYKVSLPTGNPFKMCEDGSVDFTEHDRFTSVSEGTLIAVLKKPQEGREEGVTVLGEPVRPRRGLPVDIQPGRNLREEDHGEETCFISEIGGLLISEKNRISVEPLLVLRGDVGPRTGNVTFDGSVLVKGSVRDNFTVTARENVTVKGNVGNSAVRAGENIIVAGGVIGKRGRLAARGDVSAKFAENTCIRAGGSVVIHRSALNCHIISGAWIRSHKDKGVFVGGELRAREGIDVKTLGNQSEQRTTVFVGTDYNVQLRLYSLLQKMKKQGALITKFRIYVDEIDRAEEESGKLPEKLLAKRREAEEKLSLLTAAREKLNKKREVLCRQLYDVKDAIVVVRDRIFRGVRLYFGDNLYEVEVKLSRVRLSYDEARKKVMITNL